MKYILIIVTFLILSHRAFPQPTPSAQEKKNESAKEQNTNDNHLRITITLLDTLQFTPGCNDCKAEGTFLFKVRHVSYGYYKKEFIWVKCSISKNDTYFWKNGFWWVLIKTEETLKDLPVYRHSGAF